MRTSTSGLLLILLGVTVLSGFLTGNLDRWLGYLFDPSRPALGAAGTGTAAAGVPGASAGLGERRSSIA